MKLEELGHILVEARDFETLKKHKIDLTAEERDKAMKAKAVWHKGSNGEKTCAVWKSKMPNGDVVFVTNTHRCFQTASTLDGAIKKYHDVVKDTA